MPCTKPWPAKKVDGRMVHAPQYGEAEIELACGQCFQCRLRRSRDWAMRAKHEAEGHSNNCFVTLTYANEYVPINGVKRSAIKKFMKDLRYRMGPGVRFMACGEYGPRNTRPHYHLCLFNLKFEDQKFWSKTKAGSEIYRSQTLEKIWPYGHSSIGELTAESAGYTARYVLKKVTGEEASKHYESVCPVTGEIFNLNPEFIQVSNRPGLGTEWISRNFRQVYARDSVIHKGKEVPVPFFYDKWLKANHPDLAEEVAQRRYEKRKSEKLSELTDTRLLQMEDAKISKLNQTNKREYETSSIRSI